MTGPTRIKHQHRPHQPLPQPPGRGDLALVNPLDHPPEDLSRPALLRLGHGERDRTASFGREHSIRTYVRSVPHNSNGTRVPWKRLIAVAASLVGVVAAASACSSGSTAKSKPSPTRPQTLVVAGVALRHLTATEKAACRRLASTKTVPALCPTLLPRPTTPATNPIGVYTFPDCHTLRHPPSCPLYNFAVLYGAPDEATGHGRRNTPASFLHFEMLGGQYVGDAVSLRGLADTRPLQRFLGNRTMAGHHGHLYFGLPYTRGGGEYGSHYTFIWTHGRWRYAASLHSWIPHARTLRVLAAIITHLAIVRP